MQHEADRGWDIAQARARYAIDAWGSPYFDIDSSGYMTVDPAAGGENCRFQAVVDAAQAQAQRLPLLLRFPQILMHRAACLTGAFKDAIATHGYRGAYTPAYPVKVNQQRTVVDTLSSIDGFALEAGSKPELIAVLARSEPGRVVICNGYKDREYVRLALLGQHLGLRVYLVIEKPGELDLIDQESRRLNILPSLGVRLRLASLGTGNWQNTGGEEAKFGLSAGQLLGLIGRLRDADWLDRLQMLHFHMGSQIADLQDIRNGVEEAGRFLQELRSLGVAIAALDIGGGLGVDYEGTRSKSFCSINYDMAQYAQTIVGALARTCRQHGIPHPELISESGRALSAHHAVLVTEVVATEKFDPAPPSDDAKSDAVQRLRELTGAARHSPAADLLPEADRCLADARLEFQAGNLGLYDRAEIENAYHLLLSTLRESLVPKSRADRELRDALNKKLADKYFVNLSIFQSLPDIWALNQIFPIVPLARLDEVPRRHALLKDLTCDSDGRIDRYVQQYALQPTLSVHDIEPGRPYLLGIFLTGAYQETLGDIHNLFGDTDSVDVWVQDGELRLESLRSGDRAATLLAAVGFERDSLEAGIRRKVAASQLDQREKRLLFQALRSGLDGYTYLETNE